MKIYAGALQSVNNNWSMFSKYVDSNNLPSVSSQFSKWCTSIFFFIQEFILDTYSVMQKMMMIFYFYIYLLKYCRWIHHSLNYMYMYIEVTGKKTILNSKWKLTVTTHWKGLLLYIQEAQWALKM